MKQPQLIVSAVGLILTTIVLSGCGNAPLKRFNAQGEPSLQIGYRIPKERGPGYYALLEPIGSAWKVVRFGTTLPERSSETQEILFISQDGRWAQPAYEYAEKHAYFSCTPLSKFSQTPVQNVSTYGPCGSSAFASVDVASTVGRTAIALPLTLGLGVGTNRLVNTSAIQAALRSTGLLEQVARVRTAQERASIAVATFSRNSAALGRKAAESLTFEQRIVDESGFYNRSGEQFGRFVSVEQPALGKALDLELASLPTSYIDADQFSNTYLAFEQRINAMTERLPESYVLNLHCDTVHAGPFAVKLDCAPQVRWSEISRGQKAGLTAKIMTVAPRTLAPSFTHADNTLQVRIDHHELQLTNRSSVYLEIRAVSCYVDGEISTRRFGISADQLSLPPLGQLKKPIQQSDICRDATARKLQPQALKRDDIKGRSLRFGIAVNFRRAGETADRTLFQERSLPLEMLVQEAI